MKEIQLTNSAANRLASLYTGSDTAEYICVSTRLRLYFHKQIANVYLSKGNDE